MSASRSGATPPIPTRTNAQADLVRRYARMLRSAAATSASVPADVGRPAGMTPSGRFDGAHSPRPRRLAR
jgi:hypothetical protein